MANLAVFEYWSHAAAYLPICDYRFSLYRKRQYRSGEKHWFDRDSKLEAYVLDRIKSEGALQSKDFEHPQGKSDWYSWKPAKIALTNLFMDGRLMVSERKGFQKIYDLTENVISPLTDLDVSMPTADEYLDYLITRAVKAHGFMSPNEIGYLRKGAKSQLVKRLKQLTEAGQLVNINVAGLSNDYYAYSDSVNQFLADPKLQRPTKKLYLLSPFDNLVIQRQRLRELFDFDYQIECYVPEKKRQYGYYSIPLLYGNEFVARLDAKADRKSSELRVKAIWYEGGFKPSPLFARALDRELLKFSQFCGCEKYSMAGS